MRAKPLETEREDSSPAERNVAVILIVANAYFALLALIGLFAALESVRALGRYFLMFGPGWLAFWAVVQKARARHTFLGPYGGWILFAIVNLGWTGSLLHRGIATDTGDRLFLVIIALSVGLSVLGAIATLKARRLTGR